MAAQIGLELLPLSSQAATTALNSLKISTLSTPRDQPTKFNHGAFRQRSPLEASSEAILTAAATKLPTGAAEAAAVAAVAKPKATAVAASAEPVATAVAATAAGSSTDDAAASSAFDWSALLSWEAFPLRSFPHLVKHAVTRLPALRPEAMEYASSAKTPEEAEAFHLESRKELLTLIGGAP